jgi:urease accessory protein UreF
MTVDPLYRLLAWLSPAYPIGAFSYSHGIETAVEEGLVKDRVSLVAWLGPVPCLPPRGVRRMRRTGPRST